MECFQSKSIFRFIQTQHEHPREQNCKHDHFCSLHYWFILASFLFFFYSDSLILIHVCSFFFSLLFGSILYAMVHFCSVNHGFWFSFCHIRSYWLLPSAHRQNRCKVQNPHLFDRIFSDSWFIENILANKANGCTLPINFSCCFFAFKWIDNNHHSICISTVAILKSRKYTLLNNNSKSPNDYDKKKTK